jgi:uncharacterized protein YkwD
MLRVVGGVAALLFLAVPAAQAQERSFDGDVLRELNFARTQPQAYARALQDLANLSRAAGAYDDPAAYSEAVDFLMRQPALPPLGADEALENAAYSHADVQGREGGFGHESRGGESLGDRLHRHGAYSMMMAEDISYGYANPREVVLQLIVDSGVPSRGHRANIFNPVFREAGVACAPHRVYGAMCVVDFAATMMGR